MVWQADDNVVWKLCVQVLDSVTSIYINIVNYEKRFKH